MTRLGESCKLKLRYLIRYCTECSDYRLSGRPVARKKKKTNVLELSVLCMIIKCVIGLDIISHGSWQSKKLVCKLATQIRLAFLWHHMGSSVVLSSHYQAGVLPHFSNVLRRKILLKEMRGRLKQPPTSAMPWTKYIDSVIFLYD